MTPRKSKPKAVYSDNIQITIGNNSTNVAAGKNICQVIVKHQRVTAEADLFAIHELFANLRSEIKMQTSTDTRDSASQKIVELEKAITEKKPDVSKIDRLKKWFLKNLPYLAGAVINVLINPIVGKVVEAAGDLAAGEFRRRLEI